jgi:hypothetical protein
MGVYFNITLHQNSSSCGSSSKYSNSCCQTVNPCCYSPPVFPSPSTISSPGQFSFTSHQTGLTITLDLNANTISLINTIDTTKTYIKSQSFNVVYQQTASGYITIWLQTYTPKT